MMALWMPWAATVSVPVALAAALVAIALRRADRPERGAWVAGLAVALAIPLLGILQATVAGSPGPAFPNAVLSEWLVGSPPRLWIPEDGLPASSGLVLAGLWAAASATLSIRLLRSARSLRALRREWSRVAMAGFDVLVSETTGPAVVGLFHPRIVVPRWLRHLPVHQLELVLRHEAEHIRARDLGLLHTVHLLRVALPWHPAVWYLTARLRDAIETDCDRRVLRIHSSVPDYGHTLLAIAAHAPARRVLSAPAFLDSSSSIKRRILAMTQPRTRLGRVGSLALLLAAAGLLVASCEVPVPTLEDTQAVQESVQAAGDHAFTAFDVAPSVTNQNEVQRMMLEEYPPLLRAAGRGGTVEVWLFIDQGGGVQQTRIKESSGKAPVDEAALRVARAMSFRPATMEGRPVAVWVALPITFRAH